MKKITDFVGDCLVELMVCVMYIGRFYKLINSSGSRSARLNLSESVAHPRTSAINSVRLSTHCDVVFDDLTCMDTTIPCW